MHFAHRRQWLLAPPVIALLLAGCGTGAQESEAQQAAAEFLAAVGANPQAACDLLAPDTREELEQQTASPCSQALPGQKLPTASQVTEVSVAGHSAQVRFTGSTVFLARFDSGWRVTAAGCTRSEDDAQRPYTCPVKGQ